MTRVIVTLIDGKKYEELAKISLPLMENYAKKCKADLIILDNKVGLPVPHYAKLQLKNIDADQVLFLDIDILCNPKAPDIFEAYPNQIALLDEGKFAERSLEFAFYTGCFNSQVYHLHNWDRRYFNTGVMLIPRKYLKEINLPDKLVPHYGEQSFLNLLFCVKNFPIIDLDKKYNYQIALFDRENRFSSYFLHYTVDKMNSNLFQSDAKELSKWL